MSRRAYLDYAATAPFDTRLADTMAAASWANANALYTEGRAAASQLEDARKRIAVALGAHAPSELTFTSGGSESDNTAIRGLAKPVPGVKSTHVVVSSIEHDAVLNSAKALKSEGFAVDKVDPDASGIVRPEALEALLARIEDEGGAVTLVAVQAVNNELSTIQPVRALARVAHAHQARFFTDAVQGLGKLDIDLEQSGVDAAAFSMLKEQLIEVLDTLTEREQKVLKLRFGLEDGRARTLEEVGRQFDVTRERIRQIEAKALRKLRHPSRSKKLKDFLE